MEEVLFNNSKSSIKLIVCGDKYYYSNINILKRSAVSIN